MTGKYVLLLCLSGERVQGHGAAVAAEGATAQGFPAAARPQSHGVTGDLGVLLLVHLQSVS